jgi:hypothetical protein
LRTRVELVVDLTVLLGPAKLVPGAHVNAAQTNRAKTRDWVTLRFILKRFS